MSVRRYRTQEVAGSSPAGSIRRSKSSLLRRHDDFDRLQFRSLP